VATRLDGDKQVVRELAAVVQDAGARALVVTIRGDGVMYIRAKGLARHVMWKIDALYEKGVKEGRSV